MLQDERNFIETYMQLVQLSEKTLADQFYSTFDYGKVESLGPTLPTISYALPTKTRHDDSAVKVTFKSIKPPHKFTQELTVARNATVYSVKSDLIDKLGLDLTPENLKFLLKSKVLLDSTSLDVDSGSSINVMISGSKPAVSTPAPEAAEPPVDVPVSVSASAWEKIYLVLKEDVGDEADKILAKLKGAI